MSTDKIYKHFTKYASLFSEGDKPQDDALTSGATAKGVFDYMKEFFEGGTQPIDEDHGFFGASAGFNYTASLTYGFVEDKDVQSLHIMAFDGRQGGHDLLLSIDYDKNKLDEISIFYGSERYSEYMGNSIDFSVAGKTQGEVLKEIFGYISNEDNVWPFGLIFKTIKKQALNMEASP